MLRVRAAKHYHCIRTDTGDAACNETMSDQGRDYRGCQTSTRSGKTCQKWTVQSPAGHKFTRQNFPGQGLGEHSYCRNPGRDESTIWCYTTDPDDRWDYCDPVRAPAPQVQRLSGFLRPIKTATYKFEATASFGTEVRCCDTCATMLIVLCLSLYQQNCPAAVLLVVALLC